MSYESLKQKYPELNWQEAEEVSEDDLQAASDYLDVMVKESWRPGIKLITNATIPIPPMVGLVYVINLILVYLLN